MDGGAQPGAEWGWAPGSQTALGRSEACVFRDEWLYSFAVFFIGFSVEHRKALKKALEVFLPMCGPSLSRSSVGPRAFWKVLC